MSSAKGRTFYTASSKMGRQIASASAPLRRGFAVSVEIAEWNKIVDLKKKSRKEKKNVQSTGSRP